MLCKGVPRFYVAREVVERMFGGVKTSALVLYENMQLEKELPCAPTYCEAYYTSIVMVRSHEDYCIPSIHFGTQGAHRTGNETDAFSTDI